MCNILWNIQSLTRSIYNKSAQLCWEWYGLESDYYKEHKKHLKVNDVTPYKMIMGQIDKQLREEYYQLNSANRGTSIKNVTDKYKNELYDYKIGNKSVPSYKKDMPIDLHNNSIKITIETNSDYTVRLSLFSNPYYKELGLSGGMLDFKIPTYDKRQREILNNCVNGNYRVGASKLIYVKKSKKESGYWQLNLVYSYEAEDIKKSDENVIMGVDLGTVLPAYCAILGSPKRFYIKHDEIDAFRKQIDARRKCLQNQSKWCGDGRCGHGRTTMLKPVQTISDKVSNFRNTTNDKYSKSIVNFAIRNGVTEIHMEDLSGISEHSKFLKNWSYFDLQEKITRKAEIAGITVRKVEPAYTSQTCSKCGHIDKANRPKETMGQAYFKCVKCGFETNADYNAALNIAASTNFVENKNKNNKKGVKVDEVAC